MDYFCCITEPGDRRTTISVEADNAAQAKEIAERHGSPGSVVTLSADCGPPPRVVEDWEVEGRRIALEGMDLPDGAYFAMAEELGLDP